MQERVDIHFKLCLCNFSNFPFATLRTSIVYSRQDVIKTLNEYISTKELVNPHQQQFINIDDTLRAILVTKGSEIPEFMKRNELSSLLLEKMQGWYRIEIEGKDTILK